MKKTFEVRYTRIVEQKISGTVEAESEEAALEEAKNYDLWREDVDFSKVIEEKDFKIVKGQPDDSVLQSKV